MDKYSYISNAHGAYLDELYKSYQQNPESVDASWKLFFEGFDFSLQKFGENGANGHGLNGNGQSSNGHSSSASVSLEKVEKEIKVRELIDAYRSRGHLRADTNPVRKRMDRKALLDLPDFGLGAEDLDTVFEAGKELGLGAATLRDIEASLKKIYCGHIGFEFMGIRDPEMRNWFQDLIEKEYLAYSPTLDQKKRLLSKLNEAAVLENFLHTKFIGQKRFSLEGGESTIPALDGMINEAAEHGVEEVMIGMAHRGRLNVLSNIMGKTFHQLFKEFEGKARPEVKRGDGDVKYHLGYSSNHTATNGNTIHLNLAPNPSHLEAVNPLLMGYSRALADHHYEGNSSKILPIMIHGDAAIAGQGIVYEVAQMSKLKGYNVNGVIHFIINNQVGFTTDFEDARSSIYCTDISQIVEAPELHVNGDDPEAVLFASRLAVQFRQRYQRDIYIDLVCYRKHGHNESDEPRFTQPELYEIIKKHPNTREIYSQRLLTSGDIDADLAKSMDKAFRDMLQERLDDVRQKAVPYDVQNLEKDWQKYRMSVDGDFDKSPETAISEEYFNKVGKALSSLPATFTPLKQIEKLMEERHQQFFTDGVLNWASAELLAYGSILLDGNMVRITGQDVERGTFSHRHAIVRDVKTYEKYCHLRHLDSKQERFEIYNSLLSEYGVLGFEYGYAFATPDSLVIWEAQFGDFANGAQVMIDQFITSAESKWQKMNGLVMLLPHGYEGQGPEHSNARPERFLQLSAEDNIVVANITTPANFFHLLRRQLAWEFRKPCVVMSPKSLLRNAKCASPKEDFLKGGFKEVIGDEYAKPLNKVTKALLCTGKVYFDLLEKQQKDGRKDVAIIRVEQLHPFPAKQLEAILSKYKNLETVVWVQEEPENMGYWAYILREWSSRKDLKLVSRKSSASPATGYAAQHAEEQLKLVNDSFNA